ncbi:MAG: ribonuclease HII [Tenericutes bacterium]|nr:ribonuclease HII [Mycoplasmatota bacterium]
MDQYEKELNNNNIFLIAGIDEVGRGPLVGPVVSACVVLPINYELEGLNDSKKLCGKKRNEFYKIIKKDALGIGIGIVDNNRIDEINILEATKESMLIAINKCLKKTKIEHILIDAVKLKLDIPSTSIIKGDSKSKSIAAASIIAKVTRDNIMYKLDKEYPIYDYKSNKGYPTKKHIEIINNYGIMNLYRKSFKPVKDIIDKS